MRPPEMELRQKCHKLIVRIDPHYRSFGLIQMNETSGEVIIEWVDRDGKRCTTRTSYGSM